MGCLLWEFLRNWPCYNGTALYFSISIKTCQTVILTFQEEPLSMPNLQFLPGFRGWPMSGALLRTTQVHLRLLQKHQRVKQVHLYLVQTHQRTKQVHLHLHQRHKTNGQVHLHLHQIHWKTKQVHLHFQQRHQINEQVRLHLHKRHQRTKQVRLHRKQQKKQKTKRQKKSKKSDINEFYICVFNCSILIYINKISTCQWCVRLMSDWYWFQRHCFLRELFTCE